MSESETLLRALFQSRSSNAAEARVPPGVRVYAIGDIHGRDDLLNECLRRIESDIEERPPAKVILVFLGDLIDRGPASAQVLERLRVYRPAGARTVFLLGNHEEVLLRLLRGESDLLHDWLQFGGAQCAESYGIDVGVLKRRDPKEGVLLLRERIPSEHKSFLDSFVDTFRAGSYLFVHAGIRPGIPLEQQSQGDLRWIRGPFLECDRDHGFVVVHGHTINDEVQLLPNRIGLDTGAYYSGVLTAMAFENSDRWLIQTNCGNPNASVSVAQSPVLASEDVR